MDDGAMPMSFYERTTKGVFYKLRRGLWRGVCQLLLKLVKLYRVAISPLMPARCRYYPTCSTYAHQAITWHGNRFGVYLVFKRVLSCHPWGGSGVDFVPVPLYRYHYVFIHQPYRKHSFVLVDGYSYRTRLHHLTRFS